MKVLHVHSGNLYGGVETMLVTLARHRALCADMEPHFARCFEGRLSRELHAEGVSVYPLGAARVSRPYSMWRARRRLKELLGQRDFDVVICHSAWSHAIFGSTVQRSRIPLVFYLHGDVQGRHWLERWAKLTTPDFAICNSRFTSESLTTLYPYVSSQVLHCAVAAPENVMSRADRAQIRS